MGITASIYKDRGRSCANGGISDTYDQVTIVNAPGPFEPSDDAPAVELVPGNLPGTVKAVPTDKPEGAVGPMMGGSYIATSDSRFSELASSICGTKFYGAVPLHDRYETREQYDALSR